MKTETLPPEVWAEADQNQKIEENRIKAMEQLYVPPKDALSQIIKKGDYFTGIDRSSARSLYQYDRFEKGQILGRLIVFTCPPFKNIEGSKGTMTLGATFPNEPPKTEYSIFKKEDDINYWTIPFLDYDYRLATKEEINSYLKTGMVETEFPDKSDRKQEIIHLAKCVISFRNLDYEEYLQKNERCAVSEYEVGYGLKLINGQWSVTNNRVPPDSESETYTLEGLLALASLKLEEDPTNDDLLRIRQNIARIFRRKKK